MPKLLSTEQMAEFANSGYLFFEGIIDKDINREFLNDIGHTNIDDVDNIQKHFQNIKSSSSIPRIPAGTPLENAYPLSSPLNKIFTNEIVSGAINSLVGSKALIDHQFLHLTFPSKFYEKTNQRQMSQVNHQDSTIDPPYNKENINQILIKIIKNKIKLSDTVIVIEIEKNQQIKIPESLVVWKEKIYGKTKLLFLN